MKSTLRNSMMLVLVLLLTNAGTAIFAQGKKGKKEETKEMIIQKEGNNHEKEHGYMGIKNLTDDQKQKVEKLNLTQQKEMLQLRNQIAEKKAHLKTLEIADNGDMNAINKTIEEMGSIKIDMMKKKASHKQEIRKILNDEQRLQFDLRHNNENKKGKKMKHMKMGGKEGMGMRKEIEIIKENEED